MSSEPQRASGTRYQKGNEFQRQELNFATSPLIKESSVASPNQALQYGNKPSGICRR